jgi:hypothetical protein
MQYMILIWSDEQKWMAMSPPEMERAMGAYRAYSEMLAASGKMVSGSQLAPAPQGKTISGGRVVDGPYAEIKEEVGGYYIIEVADEAEAIALAQQCPGAHHGAVELRLCI